MKNDSDDVERIPVFQGGIMYEINMYYVFGLKQIVGVEKLDMYTFKNWLTSFDELPLIYKDTYYFRTGLCYVEIVGGK